MKAKKVTTIAFAPNGIVISSNTHQGRNHSRDALWKAADSLASAGMLVGEIRQTEENAKSWAVYPWMKGAKELCAARHIRKPSE
jgi:hypothetical protein